MSNDTPDREPRRSQEVVTGFRPLDQMTPAPNAVPDAPAAFAAVGPAAVGIEVDDPQDARTEEERRRERAELEGIVKAQRAGEALSGFVPRK